MIRQNLLLWNLRPFIFYHVSVGGWSKPTAPVDILSITEALVRLWNAGLKQSIPLALKAWTSDIRSNFLALSSNNVQLCPCWIHCVFGRCLLVSPLSTTPDQTSKASYFIIFQVGSYGGKLKYTISYVAGSRGTLLEDADVQIIVSLPSWRCTIFFSYYLTLSHWAVMLLQGNDITLVARQPWQRRQQGSRETHHFEIVFREVSFSKSQ